MTLQRFAADLATWLVANTRTGSWKASGLKVISTPGLEIIPGKTLLGGETPVLDYTHIVEQTIVVRGVWQWADTEAQWFHSDPLRDGSLSHAIARIAVEHPFESSGIIVGEWDREFFWNEVSVPLDNDEAMVAAYATELPFLFHE